MSNMAKWVRVILVVSLWKEGGVVKCKKTLASLTSHTLHREKGSGHAVADELLPKNVIIKQCG